MYGAISGDIIGSRFEFDRGGKTKEFELFTNEDSFTDDTVMTIAVGEGLMNAGLDASTDEIKTEVIKSMRKWGRKYPEAGYGGNFWSWLFSGRNPKPYGSYGNGSAMRVSAAGWLYDSLERTREAAKATAEVTHNHPEGIKAAECTAAVIYMGRTGCSKDEILSYITKEFGYDFSETLDEMRKRHEHVESCQDSMPKALRSFFDGESYEDVVRNAVSLGGDTDTLAAIAGAMAEAFYGMPLIILAQGNTFIPDDIKAVLKRFDVVLGRVSQETGFENIYENNKYIRYAVDLVCRNQNMESYAALLDVLMKRILEEGEAPTPMVDKNHVMDSISPETIMLGDTFTLDSDLCLTIDKMQDEQGNIWTPLFTDEEEADKDEGTNIRINVSILTIIREAYYYEESKGLVINPFGQSLAIPKEALKLILDQLEKSDEKPDNENI